MALPEPVFEKVLHQESVEHSFQGKGGEFYIYLNVVIMGETPEFYSPRARHNTLPLLVIMVKHIARKA